MGDPDRRRRRLRHHHDSDPAGRGVDTPTASTAGVHDGDDPPPPRRRGPGGDERDGERGLRGLVGSGSSQVGLSAALRARDAARPTEDDLAEAEARVVVVRRNWVPREELPRSPR
ncbi:MULTISPECIES: hypothetical protein [unclassified Micromonospora]|uniref:hypothetical protein n=1 Tax=unclassified Micromonospora TaxID=2617518 RepID=UPI00249B46A9|nr:MULTISPECIES: hypothetical protein [unclassified Micromonospora]WFE52234.1 hypothetical protein O7617_18760 [Micromonospora sp. WMMD1155]WFF01006.1 hypothetical protein O7616_29875 [Micromonospora sp. WMMD964]